MFPRTDYCDGVVLNAGSIWYVSLINSFILNGFTLKLQLWMESQIAIVVMESQIFAVVMASFLGNIISVSCKEENLEGGSGNGASLSEQAMGMGRLSLNRLWECGVSLRTGSGNGASLSEKAMGMGRLSLKRLWEWGVSL
jgi:hypothetical protein